MMKIYHGFMYENKLLWETQVLRYRKVRRLFVVEVYIYTMTPDSKEPDDLSTHKWMVYVRGPPEVSNLNAS